MNKTKIAQYYDYTLPFYKHFWHGDTLAMHYGFWEKGTRNHKEALLNSNKFIAEKAGVKPENIILDAGCGVGGSTIWLAKQFGAKVMGITLSEKQTREARRLAKIHKVEEQVDFQIRDYTKTGFGPKTFDSVWAQESVCHAENKKDFLAESFRLLKEGGKIVVADGWLKRDAQNKKELQIIKNFLNGLALHGLDKVEQFRKSMEAVGFKNIKFWDKTQEILPSSKKIYNMCLIGYPLAKITEKLKMTSKILTQNNLAGIVQYQAIKIGLAQYGVFYGEK